jgi:uncharacterized OsmC-like protein
MTRLGRHNRAVEAKAKEFRYAIDHGERFRTEDGTPLDADLSWTPEHLLLAALVRCSVASLDYHARRAGNRIESSKGSARAMFTRRESDGRYALMEVEVDLDVDLLVEPGENELRELLAKAERDCFIGASLTAKPVYRWHVR